MPSTVKSKTWFIRIDYPHEHVREKINIIQGWLDCEILVAALHVGKSDENPHFHACLRLSSELQKQSFDARLKSLFNWKKGSDYSTKVWDGNLDGAGAGSYLYHEPEALVVCSKGATESQLTNLQEICKKVQEVVAVNKEFGTKKSIQRIIDQLPQDCGHRDICRVVADEIRNGNMYHPGKFRLNPVIEEIYFKTRSRQHWKASREQMIDQWCLDNKWDD